MTDYWTGYSLLTSQYIDTIQGMTTLKPLNAERSAGEELNRFWHSSFLGLSVAEDLFELLETEPKVTEKKDADCRSLDAVLPDICMEDVSFSYSGGTKAVKHVSLKIPGGTTAAFAGHSGSGKSTLLNLLLRFYDVSSGRILLNQVDVRDYNLDYLQKNTAVVFQDSFLFYGTIADNIRMARPDADDEDVIRAAKAANAHGFISALPDGYHTMVGERGIMLSGGQRQRIAIARALLKDTPIVIFDEAVSNLDTENERYIQDTLKTQLKGKTGLITALTDLKNHPDRRYIRPGWFFYGTSLCLFFISFL